MNDSGYILIDKDKTWTSFDVVAKLRSITGIKKIGHAGTLDPIATGLLIVAIGRDATKHIDEYMKMDKVYIVKAKLGEESDTYDTEGEIIINDSDKIEEKKLIDVINEYIGETEQIPPMYSAKKIKGKKLYELARQGKEVEREPVKIHINNIELINYEYPWFEMKVDCGSGTYIRSLVHDIGKDLNTGAVMYELRRMSIGEFNIKKAVQIEQLNVDNWPDYLINKE
ncbi:tRNA pseudouridine(55) synthase TruB [Patescibacteria group bacterium]|nr:tRNA pseudouridine(55) synthase TruB [Patescibacteria group bacterium]